MDRLDATLAVTLGDLFSQRMGTAAFERVVAEYWDSGRFIRRCPEGTAERLRAWALESPDSAYGADRSEVRFGCKLLFGAVGRPGAFHVAAPGESHPSDRLADRNRQPHAHESGRIAILTGGSAIFYACRRMDGRDAVVEASVSEGDAIFWPKWIAHTFDAGAAGFSLFSAMGSFLSPETEHFLAAPPGGLPDLDELPRVPYADGPCALTPSRAPGGARS